MESLLGRAISEREMISVRAAPFEPAPLSAAQRQEVLGELDAYFARIDAKRPPLSQAEAKAIISEALRATRPHYRPVR